MIFFDYLLEDKIDHAANVNNTIVNNKSNNKKYQAKVLTDRSNNKNEIGLKKTLNNNKKSLIKYIDDDEEDSLPMVDLCTYNNQGSFILIDIFFSLFYFIIVFYSR